MSFKPRHEVELIRQHILAFIRQFSTERGYPPSYREIANALGRVESNISDHIQVLCRQGLLARNQSRTARAFRLNSSEGKILLGEPIIRLPLMSWDVFERASLPTSLPIAEPVVPLPVGTWMPTRKRVKDATKLPIASNTLDGLLK
jgi:SOS-response transcriptional repressor LexA